jgi:hypothetical protein
MLIACNMNRLSRASRVTREAEVRLPLDRPPEATRPGEAPDAEPRRGPLTGVPIPMVTSRWIMPRADAACGRAFHPDRPSAEAHRVALAFWHRATGGDGAGCRLAIYRCTRCFGFHVARKRIGLGPMRPDRCPPPQEMSRGRPGPHAVASGIDSQATRDVTA